MLRPAPLGVGGSVEMCRLNMFEIRFLSIKILITSAPGLPVVSDTSRPCAAVALRYQSGLDSIGLWDLAI